MCKILNAKLEKYAFECFEAKPDVPGEWFLAHFFSPFHLAGEPGCHVQFEILTRICRRNLASTLHNDKAAIIGDEVK